MNGIEFVIAAILLAILSFIFGLLCRPARRGSAPLPMRKAASVGSGGEVVVYDSTGVEWCGDCDDYTVRDDEGVCTECWGLG